MTVGLNYIVLSADMLGTDDNRLKQVILSTDMQWKLYYRTKF
jgi:hypothetical protein